jgi:thiol-disulfide isomerase/thioredoxin
MRSHPTKALTRGMPPGRGLALSRGPRRGSVGRLLVLIAACGVLAACGGVGTRGSTGGYVSGNGSITVVAPKDREKAPVLAGDDLEGRQLSTADLAGHVLVINVWGSWCPPCRKEAPALAEVSRKYADRDVTFVGVLVRDKPAAALAFTRKQETPYRSIADFSGHNLLGFSRSLPSQAIPTTWIIDARGRVAVRVMDDVTASTLAGLIDDVRESTQKEPAP